MRHPLAVAALPLGALLVLPGCETNETVVVPTLVATCEARPASGRAPLSVSFLLGVTGAQGAFAVTIAYGDGDSGTNPDAPHTYASAGTYVASFTVATPTQSARCPVTVTVEAPLPPVNRPPDVVFETAPRAGGPNGDRITGPAPLTVRFDLCASSDPEGDVLYFMMDRDGNGAYDSGGTTGAYCRRSWTYAAGSWRPKVCVRELDASGQPLHEDQCRTYTVVAAP